jgi:hypothetical protein
LLERAEKLLVILSTVDPVCLSNSLHCLQQFVQKQPESMDIVEGANKEKPEAFYTIAYTLCEMALNRNDTSIIEVAVDAGNVLLLVVTDIFSYCDNERYDVI